MGVPKLETCCFVFDLKTGTTIIGVLNSVMSFVMLVTLIVTASIFGSLESNQLIASDPDAEAEATGLYVISVMLVVMYLAKFLSDLLFVYGVVREHRGIIKGYGIVWFVFFLLSSFLFFIHVMDFHAFTVVSELFYMALNIYAALLAYNFYDQINNREELSHNTNAI